MRRFLWFAVWLSCASTSSPGAQELPERTPVVLADLIREALERNPELQRAAREVDAMRARVPQAGALPDPTLSSGVINEGRAVPFDTLGTADFSEVYVGITQDVPFPGKRGLREDVAREQWGAQQWAYEIARRELARNLAHGYYDLCATRSALDVVVRNAELGDQLVELVRSRFSVGQGIQQDVLDAEVERSRLEERLSVLERQERTLEAALARWLDRDEWLHEERLAPVSATPLSGTLDEVLTQAAKSSPLLQLERKRVDAASRRVDLARRDLMPDLGFELVYHNRGSKDLDPFYTLGWTVTLPVHADRKQRKAIEEAAAELGAGRSAARAVQAEIRYAVTEAYLRAQAAERILRLYDQGLLGQARIALDSSMAQLDVGKVDFRTVVASWGRLLESEIAYHEHLASHEKARVDLVFHLGTELPGLEAKTQGEQP